jgi:hypothetical protein
MQVYQRPQYTRQDEADAAFVQGTHRQLQRVHKRYSQAMQTASVNMKPESTCGGIEADAALVQRTHCQLQRQAVSHPPPKRKINRASHRICSVAVTWTCTLHATDSLQQHHMFPTPLPNAKHNPVPQRVCHATC